MSRKVIISLIMVLAAILSVGTVSAATLDTFTVSPTTITPNGDGTDDTASITVEFNESIDYTIDVYEDDGTTLVKSLASDTGDSDSVTWDGRDSSGDLVAEDDDYIINITWDSSPESDTETIAVDLPDDYNLQGPVTVEDEVELTDEEQTVQTEFEINNYGIAVSSLNYEISQLAWQGEGHDEYISGEDVSITGPISLEIGESGNVTITAQIPDSNDIEAYGIYKGTITVKEGTEVLGTGDYELEIQPENYQTDEGKLSIREIDIADDRLFPGEETEIDVEVENDYANDDIENIEVTILIPALDIEEEAELDELKDGDDDTVTLTIKIPTDADSDDYTLIVFATGENADNGDELSDYDVSEEIEVERDSHDIIVEEIDVDNSNPSCGDTIEVKVSVTNIGKKDEEEISILLKNTELDIEATKSVGDLDEGDDATEKFEIKIPRVVSGTYLLDASVTYEDVDDQDNEEHLSLSEEITITCEGVSPIEERGEGIISGTTTKAISPGETGSYALAITNTGEIPVVYTLEVSGYSDWAEASVEPEEFLLAAGQEVPFYVYLTPNNDATGSETATLSVYEGDALIDSVLLTADITEAEEGFTVKPLEPGVSAGWFNLSQNDLIAMSMVVLAIIILAAIYAFGIRSGRKL